MLADDHKAGMFGGRAGGDITFAHMGIDLFMAAELTSQTISLAADAVAPVGHVDMDVDAGMSTDRWLE